ncbi:uncharacterized protein LOC124259243 [Haliotis rubra]|uniref:uncharacterized protein LOC124259243 n=1 Tax=Haliotis rubra TaxID=36100 RepID=UPI001EE58E72|nr:uncharacterized protein LOC124259243 [Haliotis rubra]
MATSHGMSQSCVILRENKHDRNDQEHLRKSLPPLDFSSNSPSASEANPQAKDAEDQASENQHINSNEYLRNIRLSNLLNSPVTSFDGPASPGSPVTRSMRRSHSVTSDISVFSVCSETGEKRSKAVAAAAAGRVLRNDSQYPDIPISAHAMRMASLAQHVEGQVHHDSRPEGQPMNDRGDTFSPSGRPVCDEGGEEMVKPRLNAIEEAGADQASNSVTMHNPAVDAMSPKVHRSKKKDKHKQNRHSTGSVMQGRPKKHTHSSSAQLPPGGEVGKRGETGTGASPSHRKRSDKVHGSPSSKASGSPSNKPGTGKGDSSKKKPGKPVCDSYKQYGFIDDPNFLQSRSGMVELRLVDADDVECPQALIKSGVHNDKSQSGSENKQHNVALGKPGGKTHLTSADKSSYSPSPTRQKSSRPRSFGHLTGACEGSPGLGAEHSQLPMVGQGTPKRRSRNATKSKKRVSYPVTTAEASQEQEDQSANGNPVPLESANQESGQRSLPLGLITVRNGPLSSYV